MKPPKCRLCQAEHWNSEPHKFASNITEPASNNASNRKVRDVRRQDASIRPEMVKPVSEGLAGTVQAAKPEMVSGDTKQRWSRTAYNAYQREYMKRRRSAITEAKPA